MKWIKSYKLFEDSKFDSIEKFIEEILFDISDNDIPVDVGCYEDNKSVIPHISLPPGYVGAHVHRINRCLILIGEEDNPRAKDIPLHLYLDNLSSLNDYMLDEGWELKNIACWIKPNNVQITGVRPITAGTFDSFLQKIEEVKIWNEKHPPIEWKTFKLVDICYEKS